MKRFASNELDIPHDDFDCWERYPRYRWVYDVSRLLDAQHIKWTPFQGTELSYKIPAMNFELSNPVEYKSADIYIDKPTGIHIISEVCIIKGEIKSIRYFEKNSLSPITSETGNLELRINAFVSMHFQKFTGIITITTIGNDIYAISLKQLSELALIGNAEITRLTKKIYKKTVICQVTGLSDHTLHESTAS